MSSTGTTGRAYTVFMNGDREYDARRLRELILFIARRCEGDPTFGSIKLNKILWYSDFAAFASLGKSITGARYQHLPEGPALVAMVPVLRDMTIEQEIREVRGTEGPKHRRAVALREPDLSLFEAEEVGIVTEFITELWAVPAHEVSALSHETMAWRLTEDRQEIPYGMAFLSAEEPTEEDLAWLRSVANDRVES
jgi:hypothetical protein